MRPYKCVVCAAGFKDKFGLIVHFRCHTGERPYKCKICEKSFKQLSALNHHVTGIHSNLRTFICSFCNKGFKLQSTLIIHLRSHLNEKPYECNGCSKTFQTNISLYMHLRIHSSIKDFCCTFCGHSFSQKHALDNHIRSHIKEKPLPCDLCEMTFSSTSTQYIHRKANHYAKPGDVESHQCPFCERCINNKWSLERHIRSHIKEKPHPCHPTKKEVAQHISSQSRNNKTNGNNVKEQNKRSIQHSTEDLEDVANRFGKEELVISSKMEELQKLEHNIRIQQAAAATLKAEIEARKSSVQNGNKLIRNK